MGIRFPIQPRLVEPSKVARRLGVTPAIFAEKLEALEAVGFPRPDPVLGNYSLDAVDRWIDERAGMSPPDGAITDPAQVMEAARQRGWRR